MMDKTFPTQRQKRKPGGQPGNQNGRTHGLYPKVEKLTPREQQFFRTDQQKMVQILKNLLHTEQAERLFPGLHHSLSINNLRSV